MPEKPTKEEIILKKYELAIGDEHFYRTTFQNRVNARFSILLGLTAGIILLTAKAEKDMVVYGLQIILSIFAAFNSFLSIDAIKRSSDRFMESLDVKETLEINMGLMKVDGYATENNFPKLWETKPLYVKKWAEKLPENEQEKDLRFKSNYYQHTCRLFLMYGYAFAISAFIFSWKLYALGLDFFHR